MCSRHFKQFEQESKHCVLEAIKFLRDRLLLRWEGWEVQVVVIVNATC